MSFTLRIRHLTRLSLIGACSLMFAACAGTRFAAPDSSLPAYASSSESDGDYLMRMALRVRSASGTELSAEAEGLQRAFVARRGEDNRVRLAAFLALAPAPFGDRGKALALLDIPPGDNAGRGRNHPYALLFIPLLLEYRKVEDNLTISQTKLKDELKRNETLSQSVEAAKQNAETQRQSAEALKQKLDAIRDIEKKLLERPIQK